MSPKRKVKLRQRLLEKLQQSSGFSQNRLYAHILHGDVTVDGHTERNPQRLLTNANRVTLSSSSKGFVSRAGNKLSPVLEYAQSLGFHYKDAIILDVGASTGGFCDCLLQAGASRVHTVDVGYNLLDFSLRRDPRVFVHERCNIMKMTSQDFEPLPQYAVIDLSFRSLIGAASHVFTLLHSQDPRILALLKPQFEVEKSHIPTPQNFDGVLRDTQLIANVLGDVCKGLEKRGMKVLGTCPAGIRGKNGNQEFFVLLSKTSKTHN